jgi:hypothetical protein
MESLNFLDLFQGINTLVTRVFHRPQDRLRAHLSDGAGLDVLLYLGRKGVLEALLMIPMGLGMATVNAG